MCIIPKLFPLGEFLGSMKLTRAKLIETIRKKNMGWTSYQARKIAGISVRRVNQIWTEYLRTGEIPQIGLRTGRPTKFIQTWEREAVREAFLKYQVSASSLEPLIEKDYKKRISHNRIHKILLEEGFAIKGDCELIRKKKWIRYERRHSLTAVHIDWYLDPITGKYVFAVIDDASRKLLALLEEDHATTENSIEGIKLALKHGKIKECISDHGSQFTNNQQGYSAFKEFLDSKGIKQILCRVKHPQSNGKVERFFGLYKAKRHKFSSKDEFIHWYNFVRPHLSLNFEELETPAQAFIRKMKAEI